MGRNCLENKFKVLNSDNKKWLQGTHEHARHFEGALFADTHWGLQIFFQPEKKVVVPEQIIQVQTQVSESTPTFSAALSKLGDLIENSSESLIRENIELSSENWTNLVVSSEVLKLQESINTKSQCLSFFVGVHQKSDSHELDDKESELLNNMAKAMKLSAEEYELLGFPAHYFDREDLHVSSVEEDLELKSLLAKILVQKPSMVFSLGANFTYFFLKRKEKLSLTHGNVIELRFVSENKELLFSTKVMPLFHPELLIINPNMKRTTWIDLQKAMSFIGKN
jgi:DNA polymerase